MGMFGRLGKVFKGFFALFVRNVERQNPRALLEAEIVAFNEAVASYNKNLALQAGLVERLKGQIKRQQKDVELVTARASANYQAGNVEAAGRLAFQLKQLKSELSENEQQLREGEEMYGNLSRQRDTYIKEAQNKINDIKRKLSQAEMAEAQSKLAEIASATAFDMAGSGATLERIDEDLDERIATAKGKARVALDSTKHGEWTMKEGEQKALEQQALAEFAAAAGLAAPAGAATAAPAPAPKRELGPVPQGPALTLDEDKG
jgi:phage shock protein A